MRKITNKAVSLVLVMALCISTLCGAVIFANAATAGTYSVVADSVAAGTKKTTVEVTITGEALTSGSFDLMFGKDVIDDVNFDANGNYVTPTNETVEEFRARDIDGNYMVTGVNYYKEEEYQSPIYNAEGEITGYETKTRTVIDDEKSFKENTGNKGIQLPNAYDGKVGLYDTKIEITGGTRADGTAFSIGDFTNADYATFAKGENNTTHAIENTQTINGVDYKYIYNMTDGYDATHYNSNPITYIEIPDGETTKKVVKQDINMLDKYYREYTTVDVATANLGYKISTVSEDSVSPAHAYMQYAQGFKDITFNSSAAYTSITFTVTFDFTGNCDRINANVGIDADKLTGTTTIDGSGVNYRIDDGRWGSENYIQYNAKYTLNFVAGDNLSGLTAVAENDATNNFHVHDGVIENGDGKDPINKAAIDALLAKNPDAKEGVDYFELYNARCQKCNRVTPMIAAPGLPYKLNVYDENGYVTGQKPATTTKGIYAYNNFRNISGMSVVYEDDGTLGLNLHYPSKMNGEQIFITDESGMILKYSDILENTDDKTSIYTAADSSEASQKLVVDGTAIARYGEGIMSTSMMITVKGFSAADIDKQLYVARYTPKSETETQLMGITHMISISDYLNEVIKDEESGQEDKLVAASLINYANASTTALATKKDENPKIIPTEIDLLEFGDYLTKAGSSSKYWDTNVADNGETGESWDNAIIIDSAEELVYLCKASGNETKGKYYKVADNILGFNLSTDKLNINGTLEDNLSVIMGSGKNHAGNTPGFQGHFDGNGATVYGAWSNHNQPSTYAGLFSCTFGEVTIKNIHVNKAHFTAKNATGGIIGYHKADAMCTVTVENCSVTDSYIEVTGTGYGCGVGAIIGYGASAPSWKEADKGVDGNGDGDMVDTIYVNVDYKINNCYVNLDEQYFVSKGEDGTEASGERVCHGGVAGVLGSNALAVSNCVVIGITPYATSESTAYNDVQHSGLESHFANVYTTAATGKINIAGTAAMQNRNFTGKVFQLTLDQMTGEAAKTNMPKLNWDTIWCVNEGDYPSLYAPYNIPEQEPKTIYWDGTTASGLTEGKGTKDEPYIINTVSELAYIVSQKSADVTNGKYFKVADNIANIVLQKEAHAAVMNLDSAAETKEYFESATGLLTWKTGGWESTTFCGNIDFNGVTVYGAHIKDSASNAALFCNIDAGAVISDLTLKNSYFTSAATNYQVAAIAAVSNSKNYGGVYSDGIVWINKVTVANNYLYNTSTQTDRSGVLVGASSDSVYIDDVFVYGNDATYGDGVKMPLVNNAANSVSGTVAVPDGLVTKLDYDKNKAQYFHFNMVRNSIILGCSPYDITQTHGSRFNDARAFENVYTDAETTNVVFPGTLSSTYNPIKTFTPAQLTRINVDEIYGLDAKSAMPLLDWHNALTNPDGAWYFSYLNAMPSLTPLEESVTDISPEYAAIYNAIEFKPDTYSDEIIYGDKGMEFGVYATSLNLGSKPYISFAFAFHGDYKTNRDKIQVRFTYTVNDTQYTTDPISPPAFDGSDIKNVNGWTNRFSAGRYHTYRFTDLPILALNNDIIVEACYDGGEWLNFGTFSAGGLGYEFEQSNVATPDAYYTERAQAVKALMAYAQALQLRYGTNA